MVMVRCDADEHHFDSDKYSSCPFCRATIFSMPEVEENEPAEAAYQPAVTQHIAGGGKAQIPAVGWLIVMASPKDRDGLDTRGSDYRLVPGNNKIGRGSSNDISLDIGDDKIGRDAHCMITYDAESNGFYILPGEGRNLTHVFNRDAENEEGGKWEVVLSPRELKHLDQVKMGDTILIFCPLCSPRFRWNFDE